MCVDENGAALASFQVCCSAGKTVRVAKLAGSNHWPVWRWRPTVHPLVRCICQELLGLRTGTGAP